MKIIILSTAVLLFTIYTKAQPPTDPRLKGLDTVALRILKDFHTPGVAIAVVEKGNVIFTGGYGYRDLEKKLPVTETTLFGIGSGTKAFTAALIGILEKEGKLNIDKPVRNYLPELKFYNEYTNAHATLRDMMTHRTGVPSHRRFGGYGYSPANRNELLKRIQYMEPSAELREKYQYNNSMYMALGVVVEKLTARSWEENIKERILKPLGMNDTKLSTLEMEKATNHSKEYDLKNLSPTAIINIAPQRDIDPMMPAGSEGSINSCAKDMANWLITWIYGGKFNEKEVIPAAFANQAMTLQMAMAESLPRGLNPDIHLPGYGLGWRLISYRGHYRVNHGGETAGFSSFTSFFPSDSIGIFVVFNRYINSAGLVNFIADRLLELPRRDWHTQILAATAGAETAAKSVVNMDSIYQKKNTKPAHSLEEYTGVYVNPAYDPITITLKNDSLFGELKSRHFLLKHYHYEIFKIHLIEDGKVQQESRQPEFIFHSNSKGEVESISAKLEPAVKEIVFVKEVKGVH